MPREMQRRVSLGALQRCKVDAVTTRMAVNEELATAAEAAGEEVAQKNMNAEAKVGTTREKSYIADTDTTAATEPDATGSACHRDWREAGCNI